MEKQPPLKEQGRGWTRREFLKKGGFLGLLIYLLAACGLKPPEGSQQSTQPRNIPQLPEIERPNISIEELIKRGLLRQSDRRFFVDPFIMVQRGEIATLSPKNTLLTIYDIQLLEQEIQQGDLILVEFTEKIASLLNFPPGQRKILAIRTKSGKIIPAYWLNPDRLDEKFKELSGKQMQVIRIDERSTLSELAQVIKNNNLGVEIDPNDFVRIGKNIRIPKNSNYGRVLQLRYGPRGTNQEWGIFFYNTEGEYTGFITVPPNVFSDRIQNELKNPSNHYFLRHGLDDILLQETFSGSQIIRNNLKFILNNLSSNIEQFEIDGLRIRLLSSINLGTSRSMYVVELSQEGKIFFATFYKAGDFFHFHINNAISSRFTGFTALLSAQEKLSNPIIVPSVFQRIKALTVKHPEILTGLGIIPSALGEFYRYLGVMEVKRDFWSNLTKEEKDKLIALGERITTKDDSLVFNYTLPITGLIIIDKNELKSEEIPPGTYIDFPVFLVESFFPKENKLTIFQPEFSSFNSSYYGITVLKEEDGYYLLVENERGCFSIKLSGEEVSVDEAGVEIMNLKNGKILVIFNLKPKAKNE